MRFLMFLIIILSKNSICFYFFKSYKSKPFKYLLIYYLFIMFCFYINNLWKNSGLTGAIPIIINFEFLFLILLVLLKVYNKYLNRFIEKSSTNLIH